MMAVEISEETRQIIEVPVPISLPKWAWLIITARAKALHEGDIDACVQERDDLAGVSLSALPHGVCLDRWKVPLLRVEGVIWSEGRQSFFG